MRWRTFPLCTYMCLYVPLRTYTHYTHCAHLYALCAWHLGTFFVTQAALFLLKLKPLFKGWVLLHPLETRFAHYFLAHGLQCYVAMSSLYLQP